MKLTRGQYTLPYNRWTFTSNSKRIASALLVLVLLLGGGPQSSSIGSVEAGHPSWWSCLKSAFFKQAEKEFQEITQDISTGPNGNRQCTQAEAALAGVFNKFFENQTLMQSTESCRAVFKDKSNQMYMKGHFFEPVCSQNPQVLFDRKFHLHASTENLISTKKGFYDLLGVTTEMCPDYEKLKTDMFECENEEAQQSSLHLNAYVKNYCIGYYNQRRCYRDNLEKHCKGPWMIGYDRTRVANFESVCSSTNQIIANYFLLSVLAISVSSFLKII